MATMIVKHRVASFENWQQVFDSMAELRSKHGWLSHLVLRDATDPNVITIVNRVKTLAGAKEYGQSAELRAGMAKAGVVGPPEIAFCDDALESAY
jgi:hypothetical protein